MRIRAKIRAWLKRHTNAIIVFITSLFTLSKFVASGYCTEDMTATITQWLPTIISFAMLGMVLGMLKKFGKF